MMSFKSLISRFRRTNALIDKSAWMLIAPALLVIFFIDPSLAKTLLTWMLFGLVIAGASVIISRIVFPQVDLSAMLAEVREQNNVGAGVVVAAIILFVAMAIAIVSVFAIVYGERQLTRIEQRRRKRLRAKRNK